MDLPRSAGARRRTAAFAIALLPSLALPGRAAESPVAFRTTGGDAWTFEKVIESSVPAGRCDEVITVSRRGTVAAVPQEGAVTARVRLGPGENTISAECRRDGIRRGAVAYQTWNVRLKDLPKAEVHVTASDAGIQLAGDASEMAPIAHAPIVAYEWRARGDNPTSLDGLPGRGQRITLPAPSHDGDYQITLRVVDALGRADESTAAVHVALGVPQNVDPVRAHPQWMHDAVIYGVVPTLFGPRGFKDVIARLDDLAQLGINTLWLSPVTPAPAHDFGYAVTDYFHVRESFGGEADLHELIAAAHARHLRVILDFVPNHLSERSDYFADAAKALRRSPYFSFFARTADGGAAHYFNWSNLENLNYGNPEVRGMIIEAFAHWVRAFDIDGFRIDAAWGPRERAPDFWPQLQAELRRIKPDLLLLAEASARDPYYAAHGFDAAYDWTDELGEWAWRAPFDDKAHTASMLRAAVTASSSTDLALFRFLENNDTGPRFTTRYGIERTRVAAAMLLTLPGLPSLYTGQEVAAEYVPYGSAAPIDWNDRHDMRSWYARLIALRHSYPALRSQHMRFLDVDKPDEVLAYLRPGEGAQDGIVVLLNYGAAPARVAFENATAAVGGTELVDLMGGGDVSLDGGRLEVQLPPYGVRVLKAR